MILINQVVAVRTSVINDNKLSWVAVVTSPAILNKCVYVSRRDRMKKWCLFWITNLHTRVLVKNATFEFSAENCITCGKNHKKKHCVEFKTIL